MPIWEALPRSSQVWFRNTLAKLANSVLGEQKQWWGNTSHCSSLLSKESPFSPFPLLLGWKFATPFCCFVWNDSVKIDLLNTTFIQICNWHYQKYGSSQSSVKTHINLSSHTWPTGDRTGTLCQVTEAHTAESLPLSLPLSVYVSLPTHIQQLFLHTMTTSASRKHTLFCSLPNNLQLNSTEQSTPEAHRSTDVSQHTAGHTLLKKQQQQQLSTDCHHTSSQREDTSSVINLFNTTWFFPCCWYFLHHRHQQINTEVNCLLLIVSNYFLFRLDA